MQLEAADEVESKVILKSRIAEENEKHFWIEAPIDESGRFKSLHAGDPLSISYMAAGATFYFHARVIGHQVEDNIHYFTIEKPDPDTITKVQRRSYLRVDADLDVGVQLAGNRRFLAVTRDISGGGMSIITRSAIPLQAEDLLDCWVLLPFRNGSIEHVQVKGVVVRTTPQEVGVLIMVRFTEIVEADRQKIVRYCFERQIELRK